MSDIRSTHEAHDRALVAGLVTGGSGARDRLMAAALVRRCPECRALRDGYAAAWARIGGEIAPVDPPASLRRRVLARVSTRGARPRSRGLSSILAMFRSRTRVAIGLAIILPVASLALSGALAPTPAFASASTLTVIAGAVESSLDGVSWSAAADGIVIAAGTHVRTSADARAVLTFFDGSLLTLESGTSVAVRELRGGDGVVITLFQSIGRTWSSVHRAATGTRYEIGTPTATATVRGTGFETIVTGAGATTVATSDGLVAVSGAGSTVVVGESQRSDVQPGAAPTTPTRVPPRTSLILRANVPMLAVDPAGLACGRVPSGDVARQSPRCLVASDGTITLLDPAGGIYRLVVRSETAVDAAVTASVMGADGSSSEQTARVSLGAGEQAVAPLTLVMSETVARAIDLRGFVVTATSPAKLPAQAMRQAPRAPGTTRPTAAAAATGVTQATREPAGSAVGGAPAASAAPVATGGIQSSRPDVTAEPTVAATETPESPRTALPTATSPTAARTLAPPPIATATVAPLPTATATLPLPVPTAAPTALPSLVVSPTPAPTPTPAPSPKPTATPSNTTSPAPTATPTATATATASATPTPTATPTATPTPTTPPDLTPPDVVVTAPEELDTKLVSTVTIEAIVTDSESGVSNSPTAKAVTTLGIVLTQKSSTWDAAGGRYTATFDVSLVTGTVTFTVTAKDNAFNRGQGTATTLLR